ncbi:MAG: hypothetical protein HY788_04115 [Deltaproteobacteria bacterium]|nr:hypothetical protein [Deltaproteobacteria bacterium]
MAVGAFGSAAALDYIPIPNAAKQFFPGLSGVRGEGPRGAPVTMAMDKGASTAAQALVLRMIRIKTKEVAGEIDCTKASTTLL